MDYTNIDRFPTFRYGKLYAGAYDVWAGKLYMGIAHKTRNGWTFEGLYNYATRYDATMARYLNRDWSKGITPA